MNDQLAQHLLDQQTKQGERLDLLATEVTKGFATLTEQLKEYPEVKHKVFAWANAYATLVTALAVVGKVIGGVAAFVAFVLGLLHVTSCASLPVGPDGAQAHWYARDRPVEIVIDLGLSEACLVATENAIDWWQGQVGYLRVAYAPPTDRAFIVGPGYRQIAVHPGHEFYPGQAGVTHCEQDWFEEGRLLSASIRLTMCDNLDPDPLALVAAHEIGHALGLMHSPQQGDLMYPVAEGMGWQITHGEAEWVR